MEYKYKIICLLFFFIQECLMKSTKLLKLYKLPFYRNLLDSMKIDPNIFVIIHFKVKKFQNYKFGTHIFGYFKKFSISLFISYTILVTRRANY